MNGWQRLFVVFAVIVSLPIGGIWLSQIPTSKGPQFAANCFDLRDGYSFTPSDAQRLLDKYSGQVVSHSIRESDQWKYSARPDQPIMWDDCAASLRDVVSGRTYGLARDEWWSTGLQGALLLGVFLVVVYALGWALGWIWRGFFPRRTA